MKYQEESTKVSPWWSVCGGQAALQARTLGGNPLLGGGQRASAPRRVIGDLGQLDRQLIYGERGPPRILAVR